MLFTRLPVAHAASPLLCVVLPFLLSSLVQAAEVTLNSTVETTATLSDNIDLQPRDRQSSGLVWTQNFGIDMRAEGAHSNLAVDGTLNLDTIFNDGTEVDLRPDMVALGQTELVNGLLFLDGGVSWQRQPIAPDTKLSATTGFSRNETTQVFQVNLSPTLRSRLGDYAKGELRYRYARNFIASDAIQETEVNQQFAALQSDRQLYPVRLTLTGERTDATTGGDGDLKQLTATLRTEYALSPRRVLIGIVGYDDIGGNAVEADLGGPVVAMGFRLQPGPQTQIEATAGYRYGRSNLQGLLRQHITERIQAVASYSSFLETPLEASGSGGLTIDPETGQIVNAITRLPLNFAVPGLRLEETASLTDRLDMALIGTFGRTTASVGVRWERRDFATDPDERLAAILLRLEHQLTSRFTVGLEGNYRRTQSQDELAPLNSALVRTSLNYEIGRSLVGYAAYSRNQRFSDTSEKEYAENAVLIGLRMTF